MDLLLGDTSLPGSPKASLSERTIIRSSTESSDGLHDELSLLQMYVTFLNVDYSKFKTFSQRNRLFYSQLKKERSERIALEQKQCKEMLSKLVPLSQPNVQPATLNELKEKFAKFQFVNTIAHIFPLQYEFFE